MHYPKQLIIGGVPYEVKLYKGYIEEKPNGLMCTGQIRYHEQEILLSDVMKSEYGSKVLLHEVLHGILHEYGMERYNKEDLVTRLTPALYDFLKTNDLRFIGVTGTKKPLPVQLSNEMVSPPATPMESEAPKETVMPKPRRVGLMSGANSQFSLGDIAKIKTEEVKSSNSEALDQEQPEFWITGIKVKDGVEHYKTYYECACGKKSRRYLSLEEDACECHECGVKIQKEPAIANKPMERDGFGNYFVASGIKKY